MPLAPAARARLQASCTLAGTTALWLWRGGLVLAALAGIAAGLALLAWLYPPGYAPVQRTLDRVLHALLTAITWLLLGIIYLLVFTPLRFFRAMAGRDALQRSPDRTAASYLQPAPPPSRLDRQF